MQVGVKVVVMGHDFHCFGACMSVTCVLRYQATEVIMYEVDVSIPPPVNHRSGRAVYPFKTMPVGASILVPKGMAEKARIAAAVHKSRHPGWDYATRSVDGGIRIWRIA